MRRRSGQGLRIEISAWGIGCDVLATSAAGPPKLARTFRTCRASDFSWGWMLLFSPGVGCRLAFEIAAGQPTVIASNGLTFLIVTALAALKTSTEVGR